MTQMAPGEINDPANRQGLVAAFEKRFAGGTTIAAELSLPAEFSVTTLKRRSCAAWRDSYVRMKGRFVQEDNPGLIPGRRFA